MISDFSASAQLPWTALVIGNSRLHWTGCLGGEPQWSWDTPHLSAEAIATLISHRLNFFALGDQSGGDIPDAVLSWVGPDGTYPELWLASVVPQQSNLWKNYPRLQAISLLQVPLGGLYPTLGIDRALALWGAITQWGSPTLVIDGGTALTLTGADAAGMLVGGAILPGLSLQLRALSQHTAALPDLTFQTPIQAQAALPQRWATTTPDAVRSGVLYGLLGGLQEFVADWQQTFPGGAIAMTGGDGAVLHHHLQRRLPHLARQMMLAPHLVVMGMAAIRQQASVNSI